MIIGRIYNIIRKLRIKYLKFSSVGANFRVVGFPIYVLNQNVRIGNNVTLYPNITFFGEGSIIIEDNVKIGNNVVIHATKGSSVRIKKFTIIAANTYIIDCNHGIEREFLIQSQKLDASPVEIGNDVWIGAGSIIGKGVCIGEGSVVGANSFVNKNVEKYTVVGGSPAKFIKNR